MNIAAEQNIGMILVFAAAAILPITCAKLASFIPDALNAILVVVEIGIINWTAVGSSCAEAV